MVRHLLDGIGDGALNTRGDPYAGPRIKNARWIMLMVGLPTNKLPQGRASSL
jgi:hypothetical protein